jgi:hypothetical protein
MSPRRVEEIADPQGGRNRIRRGDVVEVRNNGKAVWVATFEAATVDGGRVLDVEVYGGPIGRIPSSRFVPPGRVHRLAQTRDGQPVTRESEIRRRIGKRIARRHEHEEES